MRVRLHLPWSEVKRNAKAKPIRAKVFGRSPMATATLIPNGTSAAKRWREDVGGILRCAVPGGLAGVAQEGRKAVEGAPSNLTPGKATRAAVLRSGDLRGRSGVGLSELLGRTYNGATR